MLVESKPEGRHLLSMSTQEEPWLTMAEYTYWESELEVPARILLLRYQNKGEREEWLNNLSPHQREIILPHLHDLSASFNYYLLTHFSQFKASIVITEIAKSYLHQEQLATCRSSQGKYDTKALLFTLWSTQPSSLKEIFLWDLLHKSTFVRLKLPTSPGSPSETMATALSEEEINKIIRHYDQQRNDRRSTWLRGRFAKESNLTLFLQREGEEHLVKHQGEMLYVHKLEWIILDFEQNGKRLSISGKSFIISLEIATLLANSYFTHAITYINDEPLTYPAQLERLFSLLRQGKEPMLKLLEIGLAPHLECHKSFLTVKTVPNNHTLLQVLEILGKTLGSILECVKHLTYLKIQYQNRTVTLHCELLKMKEEHLLRIRYYSHQCNIYQRKQLEEYLKEQYGIIVYPTKKKLSS